MGAAMNLREGTRRLALLLGVSGAITGGLFAYAQLQSTMRQRADHKQFEELANSQVILQTREAVQHPDFIPNLPAGYVLEPLHDFKLDPPKCGIATIHWSNDFQIRSLEMESGQTLYPTPAPGIWSYCLIAIMPLLGFFVPWGTIRAIGWVAAGFVQPSK